MDYEESVQLARARNVLDILIKRPRKAYEVAEAAGLSFDETHETLDWLRAYGHAARLDTMGELYPDWVACTAME